MWYDLFNRNGWIGAGGLFEQVNIHSDTCGDYWSNYYASFDHLVNESASYVGYDADSCTACWHLTTATLHLAIYDGQRGWNAFVYDGTQVHCVQTSDGIRQSGYDISLDGTGSVSNNGTKPDSSQYVSWVGYPVAVAFTTLDGSGNPTDCWGVRAALANSLSIADIRSACGNLSLCGPVGPPYDNVDIQIVSFGG
jgi:hypothetical protein